MNTQSSQKSRSFCQKLNITYPIIGGAMYPCSNPELVAAVSNSGGIGIIQPIALTYAHGYSFKDGLKKILSLTDRPVGMNVIVEKTTRSYETLMRSWVDIALQHGIKFFVTSLGNPKWMCEKAQQWKRQHPNDQPVLVYHDVTSLKWAKKAQSSGVDGLIAVNHHAGGHAGLLDMKHLYESLVSLNLPIIAAGGISDYKQTHQALQIGYEGIQIGTRLIASKECSAHIEYKKAICSAKSTDIMLTERISGIPVAVIATQYAKAQGGHVSKIQKWLLRNRKTKKIMRTFYALRSLKKLPSAAKNNGQYQGYWQAGKSVENIHDILSVSEIVQNLAVKFQ